MFQWNWDSVASECSDFLGPAGYGFVQVNPPQEHLTGDSWWTDYQVVSYQLTSKHGRRDQFANMVKTCHDAGVGVIIDTIWNHMAGFDSGAGVAGSSFTKYNYAGIYKSSDFHSCRHKISNWHNATEIQQCELAGLADLATEKEHVRARLAEYGNDLINLGVDGFRLDAAKHMPVGDISNIMSRLQTGGKKLYVTQEVVYGENQPITPNEYTKTGAFRYMNALRDAFTGTSHLSDLKELDKRGWVPGSQANVFVANHDSERKPDALTPASPSNAYLLATIFSLAHPYGTPTILSSYSFSSSDSDGGPPNSGAGVCSSTGGAKGWLCQHRWPAVSGMVAFRNTVGDAGITHWVAAGTQRVAFGRGKLGFVAINNADATWSSAFNTSLPDGTYCDVVAGKAARGECAGQSYRVSSGLFKAKLAARSALAMHTGSSLAVWLPVAIRAAL
ncbi:glycoside hydrolase family 13 protein [Earliella scabrosa]|nr:glycoside hydrolase family 13 protein [Earliella scabrosa]